MTFTYRAYENLINSLLKNKYTITDYHAYQSVQCPCILRHDVDYSLEQALPLAELEHSLGIQSTWFVLVTGDFYNIFSKHGIKKLNELMALGHEIGLHFDETVYSNTDGMIERILHEKNLLEEACQHEVSVVSMHRPSKGILEQNLEIPGMINSYSREFFQNFKYVSDSRMRWREDIMTYINDKTYDRLHILTHAFWYRASENTMKTVLGEFVDKARTDRYGILKENFTNLEEVITLSCERRIIKK